MPPTKALSRYFNDLGYTVKQQRSVRPRARDQKENATIYLKPSADIQAAFETYKEKRYHNHQA